jgi:preprotein translocase subunit SecG
MANVLIVAYLLIVLALIAVILLQRSEGGALGIGGGGSGFMTARGSANLLTRTTAILATLFFATAIGLTILSELDRGTSGILERATAVDGEAAPTTVLDALNSLQSGTASDLPVPASDPAAPAGTDPVTQDIAPAATQQPAPAAAVPEANSDLPVPEAPAEVPAAPAQTPAAPATN